MRKPRFHATAIKAASIVSKRQLVRETNKSVRFVGMCARFWSSVVKYGSTMRNVKMLTPETIVIIKAV